MMQISPLYASDERLEALVMKKTAPQNRSEEDIAILCPDISESTIERTLKDLLGSGFVEKVLKSAISRQAKASKLSLVLWLNEIVGKGRATGYVKKVEKQLRTS